MQHWYVHNVNLGSSKLRTDIKAYIRYPDLILEARWLFPFSFQSLKYNLPDQNRRKRSWKACKAVAINHRLDK